MYIDEIVHLYQTNPNAFESLGVNLDYYLDILPKDIREEVKSSLENESVKKSDNDLEYFIVNQINNAIKNMELNPSRLEKLDENEISDDIKARVQSAFEMKDLIIEREARGGYSAKSIGEMDFFIYKSDDYKNMQLAIGENKVWGKFEKQLNQLLGYANKNIDFGFTVVINKNTTYQEIKDSQKRILEEFNVNR